jgi:hypothetical protein
MNAAGSADAKLPRQEPRGAGVAATPDRSNEAAPIGNQMSPPARAENPVPVNEREGTAEVEPAMTDAPAATSDVTPSDDVDESETASDEE